MLSATEPSLAGGPGDTPVFELAGDKPGGTMLILGGTHPQEIGGMLAAVLVIENVRVKQGRLIVVPQANRSGFTHTDPMEAYLHRFTIDTPAGPRWFRVGMRLTNPADQWPDPDVFVHSPSGERMVGHEVAQPQPQPSGPARRLAHGARQPRADRAREGSLAGARPARGPAGISGDQHDGRARACVRNRGDRSLPRCRRAASRSA